MTKDKLEEIKAYVKRKMDKSNDPLHEWKHAKRVCENCRKIVKALNLEDKVDYNLLQATCYLHDINHIYYPPGILNYFFETRNSKRVLPKILSKLKIKGSEKKIIEDAVYSSSFSFPFRKLNKDKDLYTQVLQDADTLDFFNKDRIKSFLRYKRKFFFLRLIAPFSHWAINFGRKKLCKYLNFPQISEKYEINKSKIFIN
ncbi:HD domain-containing protein [Candidatus Woesebacteria bacterium]|nr:HD domain-containing protein [Candidatus Woesebacteria bacterium]